MKHFEKSYWYNLGAYKIDFDTLLATLNVGAMTQVVNILGSYPEFNAAHGTVALLVYAIISCIGSYVLGLIDTKVGTKKQSLFPVSL